MSIKENKHLSIYEFKDGYFAIGYEGERRSFVPSFNQVEDFLKKEKQWPLRLNGRIHIHKENMTLEEYFLQYKK